MADTDKTTSEKVADQTGNGPETSDSATEKQSPVESLSPSTAEVKSESTTIAPSYEAQPAKVSFHHASRPANLVAIPDTALTTTPTVDADAITHTLASPTRVISSNQATLTHPPPLNYTLQGRKRFIFIFWSLILIDSIAIPVALYFGLWYGTDLSHNAVFSISTGALGGVSILEYFLRFYRLWKKGSTCRVIGARRWYLDWFHWNFSIAWIFIMVELIVGTIPAEPPIRLLAMPVSSLCFWFAFQLLAQDVLRYFGYRTPIRISSVPEGDPFRPGIYSIVEDIVAVDGSGGTAFRKDLDARFRASHDFRQMLHRLTAYWGLGALGAAILTTALVFTLGRDAAYVVGWTVPFLWAGIFAVGTIWYVKRCLRRERKHWAKMRGSISV